MNISIGGRYLERATLRFFLEDVEGLPSGPISLFHAITDNSRLQKISHYEDVAYSDTLLDLVHPTDAGQAYYEVDVTELVRADYAADGTRTQSAFRFQVDGVAMFDDDQSNSYRLTMPGGEANQPQLVLTFVPEPSTVFGVSVCIVFGMWLATRRRVAFPIQKL